MITLLYKFILCIRKLPRFLIKNAPKLIMFLIKTILLGESMIFNILDRFYPISIFLCIITVTVGLANLGKILDGTNYNFGLQLMIMMVIVTISTIIINLLASLIIGIIIQLCGYKNVN